MSKSHHYYYYYAGSNSSIKVCSAEKLKYLRSFFFISLGLTLKASKLKKYINTKLELLKFLKKLSLLASFSTRTFSDLDQNSCLFFVP